MTKKNNMAINIYAALEQLGLTAQKRAIHIQFSNTDLNNKVFLQRVDGTHQLNDGVHLQLICLCLIISNTFLSHYRYLYGCHKLCLGYLSKVLYLNIF